MADKTDLQQEQVELLAQRQGISALKDKDQLESEINKLNAQLADHIPDLMVQDTQFTNNVHAAERLLRSVQEQSIEVEIPALAKNKLAKVLAPVLEVGSNTGIDASSLQTKDWVDNSALEQRLELLWPWRPIKSLSGCMWVIIARQPAVFTATPQGRTARKNKQCYPLKPRGATLRASK